MIQGFACQIVLIFRLFTIPKCDLVEVEKAFLQLAWHFQPLFCLWTSPKCDLGELKNDYFIGCKTMRTHFLNLDQPKL